MKLWIDDVRPAPEGYVWCKSVNEAKFLLIRVEAHNTVAKDFNNNFNDDYTIYEIELIDIDHDAGDFASDGGDYIKLLDWLEETGRNYPIRIHSMNPVGVANMRAIIEKNGWKDIK
jgi:hypothetical protein